MFEMLTGLVQLCGATMKKEMFKYLSLKERNPKKWETNNKE